MRIQHTKTAMLRNKFVPNSSIQRCSSSTIINNYAKFAPNIKQTPLEKIGENKVQDIRIKVLALKCTNV